MVETDADLLQSLASRQQVLRTAIFGFEHFSHDVVLRWCGPHSKFALFDSRLAMIRFLCESGGYTVNLFQMPRSSAEGKISELKLFRKSAEIA